MSRLPYGIAISTNVLNIKPHLVRPPLRLSGVQEFEP